MLNSFERVGFIVEDDVKLTNVVVGSVFTYSYRASVRLRYTPHRDDRITEAFNASTIVPCLHGWCLPIFQILVTARVAHADNVSVT